MTNAKFEIEKATNGFVVRHNIRTLEEKKRIMHARAASGCINRNHNIRAFSCSLDYCAVFKTKQEVFEFVNKYL